MVVRERNVPIFSLVVVHEQTHTYTHIIVRLLLLSEMHKENVASGGKNEIFQKCRGHITYLY